MSVDDETRAVYTAEAARYETVIISETERRALDGFLALLRPASHILDIGCGPGLQAVHMQAQGHRVTGWDVTPTFVEAARARGVDAQLGQFADLDETEAFDGVLASFSLLHTPISEHSRHIGAMARALRHGGHLLIGMKLGEGEHRDRLGRFYAYVTREGLETMVTDAGLSVVDVEEAEGAGLAGAAEPFILMTCQKPDA
jgi:SAM-dependent methyltransferase